MNRTMTTVRRSTLAAMSGLAATLAALTMAFAPMSAGADGFHDDGASFRTDGTATGNLVDVQVLVQGRSAPLFVRWDQSDRFYFQAFKGRNYSLLLHNRTGERVGVLIAVDGLNVVTGERSGLAAGEPMYVLGPWESATIRGWRTSLQDVRQFVFVDEERSYAERTGQANGDMGWIRVLSFRENRPLAVTPPWGRIKSGYRDSGPARGEESPAPAPSTERDVRPESRAQNELAPRADDGFPGTGWGDRRNDPVRRVQFDPQRTATDQLVLRYEYESGLRALGIFPRHRRTWMRERGELGWGFARPPRW